MLICEHHPDYQVPLIWTFAFNGYEYWCPFCNDHQGMLGAGTDVPDTAELSARLLRYKEVGYPYLEANSTLVCSAMEWPRGSGTIINREQLPAEEVERCRTVREAGWTTGVRAEDWPLPSPPRRDE